MKNLLFLFLLSGIALSATSEFTCYLEDDFDDWNIYIIHEHNKVRFFDNDHWSTLSLTRQYVLDTELGQKIFEYEGVDGFFPEMNYYLRFNETEGRAILFSPTDENEKRTFLFKCRQVKEDIWLPGFSEE